MKIENGVDRYRSDSVGSLHIGKSSNFGGSINKKKRSKQREGGHDPVKLLAEVVKFPGTKTFDITDSASLLDAFMNWQRDQYARHVLGGASDIPPIGRVSFVLLASNETEGPVDGIARSVDLAIVSHVLRPISPIPAGGRRISPLPKWRLRRVLKFIEDHTNSEVSLGNLASVAGLTRMHFAAQFKEATGMRPHDFLLHRRIEQAKGLLCATSLPLVQIALNVGFKTQAHFTVTFRRFVGQTPYKWRRDNR
jgi:AraC family transcriptional regulator